MKTAPVLLALLALASLCYATEFQRQFEVAISGNCTGRPVTVTVKDLFDGSFVRAQVTFKANVSGMWSDVFFNWTSPDSGRMAYSPADAGPYFISVTRPGYIEYDKVITVDYCPECRQDADCAGTQFCTGGNCINITGTCGYAENHRWTGYICCADSDCAGDELCSDHSCLRLTGACGRAESHRWLPYDCCADSDCGNGKKCADHACVLAYECTSDGGCASNKKCVGNMCVALTGECGYASDHRWVSYECCMDSACPSGWCRGDHTCSPTPRETATPTPQPFLPPAAQGIDLTICLAAVLVAVLVVVAVLVKVAMGAFARKGETEAEGQGTEEP